jgi:anti-anti-sigma factor
MLKPDIRIESNVTIITLGPEFETIHHDAMVHCVEILDWAKTVESGGLVLDLKHTRSIASEFLGLAVELWRVMFQRGEPFAICAASSHCRQIFASTKLDTLFDQFETCEEAVAAYSAQLEAACH